MDLKRMIPVFMAYGVGMAIGAIGAAAAGLSLVTAVVIGIIAGIVLGAIVVGVDISRRGNPGRS